MKLEEILALVQKELPWDRSDIAYSCQQEAKLSVMCIEIWAKERANLIRLESKLQKLQHEKHQYYSGAADAEVYKIKPFNLKIRTESGIQKYIDSDDEIIKIREQIELCRTKIEAMEWLKWSLKNRTENMKTAMADIRFKSGE